MTKLYKVLWVASFPVVNLEPSFREGMGRMCIIECHFGGTSQEGPIATLVFDGVEAYQCTYLDARDLSVTEAYGRVIEVEDSSWLTEIKARLNRIKNSETSSLRHLMVDFDDGPRWEFVCRKFTFQEQHLE